MTTSYGRGIVAVCEITSWAGVALGAQHYYGQIRFEPTGLNERLWRRLDVDGAVEHNKGLQRLGRPNHEYRQAGDVTEGFPTRAAVVAEAVRCFRARAFRDYYDEEDCSLDGALFLIVGSWSSAQPQEVVACAPGLEAEMAELNRLFEDGNGWWWERDDEKRLDGLCEQWFRVLDEVETRCSAT